MSTAALVSFFQFISVVFSGLVVLRLYTSGLYRRYRLFFVYFAFRVPYLAFSVIRYGHDSGSRSYLNFFLFTEPIVLIFYVLVVFELYGLVLERYKGLHTLGRWLMYVAITVSATISLLSMLPRIAPSTQEPSKYLFREVGVERGVDFSLVIFILLIVLFLARYPVPLSRNVIVHTVIYAVFFLSETLVLLLRTLVGWTAKDTFNICQAALSAACTVAWCLFLSAKGEEVQVHAPQFRPEAEKRILEQLDGLNATLMKVSQK
jgi:hypothetical protein